MNKIIIILFFSVASIAKSQSYLEYRKVISDCKLILNTLRNDAETITTLGVALNAINEYDSAKSCFLRALEWDSSLFIPYYSMARLYIYENNYDSALFFAFHGKNRFQKKSELWYLNGLALFYKKKFDEAYSNFVGSLSLGGDYYQNSVYKALVKLHVGKLSDSEKELLLLNKRFNNDQFIQMHLGYLYLKLKDFKKAKFFLNKAYKIDSKSSLNNYFLICYFRLIRKNAKSESYRKKINDDEYKRLQDWYNGCS